MSDTYMQRDAEGRIIGLQHASDPLGGAGRGLSATAAAAVYVRSVQAEYALPTELLSGLEQRAQDEFAADAGLGLRLFEAKAIGAFNIVTFQLTFQGLSIREAGLVVRMRGLDNEVTGSASSVDARIEIASVRQAPAARAEQAEKVLRAVAKGAKLDEFVVNHSRDLIYRYQPDDVLPRPEPGEPERETPSIPPLKVPDIPRSVRSGSFRHVREVLFGTSSKELGALNWRALVDWRANVVLFIRPLVAEVTGSVFLNDPISLSGNPQLEATAAVALLDAQREIVTLERLILPGGAMPVGLNGQLVAVQDLDAPNIAPPTEPGGASADFTYTADSDDFAATCAYYTHDWLYRLVETLGFDLNTYFDGATFPVPVDHRWQNTVNAQAPGNAMGNGILRFRYSFADSGSNVGIATDPRVVAHEFGHGILWDHLSSPNFGFAHGLGDALAAILFDPDSVGPDRFDTFPFNNVVVRRHDRAVASGWGWGGTMDVGGYVSTQIVSTTIFRIYRSLGGDDGTLDERQFAARYVAYMMLQAVPLLSGVVPNTPEGFSSAMQESDVGTVEFEGASGAWAHKVVRWGFEKQDLYGGAAPAVDIYIDDGRAGEYPFAVDLDHAPDIWNRARPDGGTSHESPRQCVENYLYVRVRNRGCESARGVAVRVFRETVNKGRTWPDDWAEIGEVAVPQAILPGKDVVVGPIPWCPEDACDERVLASATTKLDRSNVDSVSSLPARRLVLADNNVAVRAMEVVRPEDDKPCKEGQETFRYPVKFVCGCAKPEVVAGGRYFTAINVGNASGEPIVFSKRFSTALPNERPGQVSEVSHNELGPYEALEIDCADIARHMRMPECCFMKGFVVLQSRTELDVTAVYTAAKADGEVESIDIEEILPRKIVKKRDVPPPDDTPPPQKPQLPDLIPVKPFPPGPPFFPSNYCASPRELRVIVRNQGAGPAGPSTTRVEFTNEGIVETRPTPALGPGDETTVSFPIPPGCVVETCPFRVTVNANPADGVTETNVGNNSDVSSCGIAS